MLAARSKNVWCNGYSLPMFRENTEHDSPLHLSHHFKSS